MATPELKGPTLHADRRRHTRTPVGVSVRVHFAGRTVPVTLELADASHGGCYFKGAAAPPAAKLAFGFTPVESPTCLAAGRVLRVDRNGFAVVLDRSNDEFSEFLTSLSGPNGAHIHAA
jgi:hypothetical protein